MAIPKTLRDAQGTWNGTSTLHQSWLEAPHNVQESPSNLSISLDPVGSFALVDYDWVYNGELQHGQALISGSTESGEVTSGWSDSWHQNTSVMALAGTGMDGEVSLKGEYAVEGHPNWGWRITFGLDGDRLLFRMFNISPEGDEEWAVEAVYAR